MTNAKGYAAKWRECNRAHTRSYMARWREEHREGVRKYHRDYMRRYKNPKAKMWHRNWFLRRKYGITLEQYNRMLSAQAGACGICGRKPPFGLFEFLSVDHDHETGKVRGLLCAYCNSFLGRIEDDASKVVNYLQKSDK